MSKTSTRTDADRIADDVAWEAFERRHRPLEGNGWDHKPVSCGTGAVSCSKCEWTIWVEVVA